MTGTPVTLEDFFADCPPGMAVLEAVVAALGDRAVTVRATKSQVAVRRRRGFAYVWLPGRYLRHPTADVVLSIALPRHAASARFKEVAHPAPRVWMHHLEVRSLADIDDEVGGWLAEAWAAAG